MTDPILDVINVNYEIGISHIPDLTQIDYENFDFYGRSSLDIIYIEIDQSLDMMFKTAKLVISDRKAFRENFPLTGNEVITIRYRNKGDTAGAQKIIHFRIFSLDEIPNNKEQNAKNSNFLSFNLVEFPAFDFLLKNKVYLTYPWGADVTNRLGNIPISTIVTDTLNLVPGIKNWYDLQIDNTLDSPEDLWNFYVPNWTPSKVLKYLTKYAIDKDNRNYGNFSFTTLSSYDEGIRPQFIYRSAYKYLEPSGYRTYSAVHTSTTNRPANPSSDPSSEELDGGFSYAPADYVKSRKISFSDSSNILFSRLSGNTVATFDYLDDNRYFAFDYKSFKEKYKSFMGQFNVHPQSYGNQWSNFTPSHITNKSQLESLHTNNFEKRTLKSIKCNIQSHINQMRNPGEKAFIYLPSEIQENLHLDLMMSGFWITWSVKDIITQSGEGQSMVTFYKDTLSDLIINPNKLDEVEYIGEQN